jgi:transglutaminase-like putative cysteine protease
MTLLRRAPAATLDARALPALYVFAALAVAPHVLQQPWWVTAAFAAALAWRSAGVRVHQPGRIVRLALAALAVALVLREFHSFFGRDPGFALLLTLGGLKLFELGTPRDYVVGVLLFFVVVAGGFLYEQSLWVGPYAAVAVMAGIVALARLAQPATATVPALRLATVLVLQALPLMLVLYVLFPRVHGTLWGLPSEGAAARAGLSDTMRPGSIGSLVDSGETAFRASFDGRVPAAAERYWRALVLWQTDGRGWQRGTVTTGEQRLQPLAEPYSYRILLEASDKPFLPALDVPATRPDDAVMLSGRTLERRSPANERYQYELTSYPRYRQGSLDADTRRAALQLGREPSSRVRALAARFAAAGGAPAIAQAALRHFRSEEFVYTLRPPLLGDDPVDEFLFETRRGFCEHYAGAFVTLMRVAGVPARVVLGYLGGELNASGNYFIVRQSDAHAWAEIWVEGDGWLRVDPTAAVAPERIELGIEAVRRLEAEGLRPGTVAAAALERVMRLGIFERAWLHTRLYWDLANLSWYRWVMDYTPERQLRLLARLGLEQLTGARLAALLAASGGAILLAYALWFARRRAPRDPVQRAYERFCRKLARAGIVRAPYEGAHTLADRAARERPDLVKGLREITTLYEELRYGSGRSDAARLSELRRKVAAYRV